MKAALPLIITCSLLFQACARIKYDPDYTREATQIQDVEYPANTIVGMWLNIGVEKSGSIARELRVYDLYNADGTGVSRTVKLVPAIYNKYKDLFDGVTDFSGELTVESDLTWKYLGKNKWEVVSRNCRLISQPAWIKDTTLRTSQNKFIVRYHNEKLFFPHAHCTSISMKNEAVVKAKLATIRSINEAKIIRSLDALRARLRLEKQQLQTPSYSQPQQQFVPPGYYMSPYGLMPLQDNYQGYNPGYGGTQYYR